jgi:tetratricopeptide (TPR) repeat protein
VIALYACAAMAKPLAVTFPCVLLLIDVWPLQRLDLVSRTRTIRERLQAALPLVVEKLPLFVISGICSWLTILCQQEAGVVSSFAALPFSARMFNALLAVLYYLRDTIWPAWLSVFYPHPALYGSPPGLLPDAWLATLSAAIILIATVAFWRLRARFPWLLVGWLWFLGPMVPMIGLFQVGLQQRADRYMYLPGLGLILGIVASLPWDQATFRTRRLPRIGIAIVIAGFAVTASLQVGVWRSSQTLFEQALLVDPRNPVAHLNLGEALLEAGQLPVAEEHLRAAIRFSPDYALAYYNLGVLQGQRGNAQAALASFEKSISLDPANASAWVRRGGLLGQVGQFDLARQDFQQALAIDPHDLHARFNLGLIDEMQGNWESAREAYLAVLRQDPTFGPAARQLEQLNE